MTKFISQDRHIPERRIAAFESPVFIHKENVELIARVQQLKRRAMEDATLEKDLKYA